ncbi:MAG: copper-translocating P-type ATPase [Parcubacteria group bacterium]|jgi:Cu+-exporting ATPase|nr:copper-translocating P-type ATPase [Parcubacteria group bacterium]|tara:strand:- start:3488 stop:5830 length:2343 start_codon:yes stop_codon:yes gene_type:complete
MKKTYKIIGMHCASCVRTIEQEAESDLAVDKNNQMVLLKVVGMDSPHCAMVVGRAIKKLAGIKNIDLDFSNQRAKVVFNPLEIDLDEIFKVILDAGYQPIKEQGQIEDISDQEAIERKGRLRILKLKLVIGGVLSLGILLGSLSDWLSFVPELLSNNWTLFILATPVQFWVGWQFYSGLKLLIKYRTADMNTLIAIGALSAYLYSSAVAFFPNLFTQSGLKSNIYFDTSAIIIILILLGKYFEIMVRGRASEAIKKLIGLQPKMAMVVREGREMEVKIEEVQINDLIIVRPGEKVPIDGEIIEGESEIDESMVTGESMPVYKEKGDAVIGSTINEFGAFTFKATKVGKDTVLSQIIKMVQQAQGSKAPIQRLADLVASYFVPIVIGIAILTFIIWIFFGPSPAFNFALVNFVSVLIIACPCALGLATPMAIMVSSGSAARQGILVKDATSLEIGNKIDTVVLDKTGTLTQGEPQLTDVVAFDNEKEVDVFTWAVSLEQRSEHPLAKAIMSQAKKEKIELYQLDGFKAVSGKGLKGFLKIDHQSVEAYLGNRALIKDLNLSLSPYQKEINKLEAEGKTVMILVLGRRIRGVLAVADVIKKESKKAIQVLKNRGLAVWMMTGDNQRTAQAIAFQLGIENVMSEVLPEQKSEKIRALQKQGKIVAMVGDGINDAPALTQANIGIAMGQGTDIAMESANITLIRGDLMLIPEVINLSKKTMRVIKQNLFWAFFYNSAFIPVAAGILYPFFGILLSPIFAAVAMAFSSISVILNSLRLKRIKLSH